MKNFEYKIGEIQNKVERLGTVAWVAAAASFSPDKCEQILDDVLYAIKNMSEQICSEIDTLCDEMPEQEGVST